MERRYVLNISFYDDTVKNIVSKFENFDDVLEMSKSLIDITVRKALIKDNYTNRITWLK